MWKESQVLDTYEYLVDTRQAFERSVDHRATQCAFLLFLLWIWILMWCQRLYGIGWWQKFGSNCA